MTTTSNETKKPVAVPSRSIDLVRPLADVVLKPETRARAPQVVDAAAALLTAMASFGAADHRSRERAEMIARAHQLMRKQHGR